jgi:hypothetical protein
MRGLRPIPPERGIAPPARTIPDDHFSTGVWGSRGPLGLRQYSCVMCGHRSTTMTLFRLHLLVCRDREVWEAGDAGVDHG